MISTAAIFKYLFAVQNPPREGTEDIKLRKPLWLGVVLVKGSIPYHACPGDPTGPPKTRQVVDLPGRKDGRPKVSLWSFPRWEGAGVAGACRISRLSGGDMERG